nr:ABC transporter substrate-binding protein [Bacillota bacterium]
MLGLTERSRVSVRRLGLALSLVAALVLAAAPAALAQTPKYGGVWYGSIANDPPTLDPAYAVTGVDGSLVALLYDGLVGFDTEGRVIPNLAKSWEISEDGRTYTFYLVDNAYFHNGDHFTAADVKYSFERVLHPATLSPRTWVLDRIAGAKEFMAGEADEVTGIRIIDDYTIEITLEQPFAPFLTMLGMPAAHIVNRRVIESYADPRTEYAFNPVGTGPFMLARYNPGDRIIFAANERYHQGRPYLDGIQYRIINDAATRIAEFEAGNLHATALTTDALIRFQRDPRYRDYILTTNDLTLYFIGLNATRPPFDDYRVRQAVSWAVDRELLAETVVQYTRIPAQGPIPPGLDGYRPDLVGYGYDPAKARQLLAEAGYPNGLTFEVHIANADVNVQLFEPIQLMMAEAGIHMEIVLRDLPSILQDTTRNALDAFYASWLADYPDAENFLYPLFHSDNFGAGGNRTSFSHPEVDRLIELAQAETDRDRRIQLYHQIEDLILEQAPRVFLFYGQSWVAIRPEVRGYELYRIFNANKMTKVWLDQ